MSGTVRFHQGRGWANDWVTNWTAPADRIGWDVDVVRAGRFRVTLLYTCPAADVGAKVRVEAGTAGVEGVIAEAHDPKPIPSPDRVARKEAHEKVWGELPLGTLALTKGRARLTVRAVRIPGKQAGDLKAVRLERVS